MNSTDANQPGEFPGKRVYTAEEQAKYLALYKSQFDPLQAEREFREMLEKGGVGWEQLMQELDEIDRQAEAVQSRSP
jgi:hypothetical protein